MVGIAWQSGSSFEVAFDVDGLFNIEIPASDASLGHNLFLSTFFSPTIINGKPMCLQECQQQCIYGECGTNILVGTTFETKVKPILTTIATQEFTESAETFAQAGNIKNNSKESSSIKESLSAIFGNSMKLHVIEGDGNCLWRCFAVILYSLLQILKSATDITGKTIYDNFQKDFASILKGLHSCDTMKSAETNCHMPIRHFFNTQLIEIFSDPQFLEVVEARCKNKSDPKCKPVCDCSLLSYFESIGDPTEAEDMGSLRIKLFYAFLSDGAKPKKNKVNPKLDAEEPVHSLPVHSLKGIMAFLNRNSKRKAYSGMVSFLIVIHRIKKYCCCPLIMYQEGTNVLTPPGDDQIIEGHGRNIPTTFIVFTNHSTGNEFSNHFQILASGVPQASRLCMLPSEIENLLFFKTAQRNAVERKVRRRIESYEVIP